MITHKYTQSGTGFSFLNRIEIGEKRIGGEIKKKKLILTSLPCFVVKVRVAGELCCLHRQRKSPVAYTKGGSKMFFNTIKLYLAQQ